MARTQSQAFRGGAISPGQGLDEDSIHPLVINRVRTDGTPDSKQYDPLQPAQVFDFGRLHVSKNGVPMGSYDPFDTTKTVDLPAPDYEQDDPDAADYIKNRPTYKTEYFDGSDLVVELDGGRVYTPDNQCVCVCDDWDGGWNFSNLVIEAPTRAACVTIVLSRFHCLQNIDLTVKQGDDTLLNGTLQDGSTYVIFIRGDQATIMDWGTASLEQAISAIAQLIPVSASSVNQLVTAEQLSATIHFVTPEMFGAVGDGVTDDTNAFIAMVAASDKYLLTQRYVVSGIVIAKTVEIIGTPGNSLIALNNTQEFVLRLDSGRNNRIIGVNFDGKGSTTQGQRGNVVGLLLNSSSTVELTLESCTFNMCKTGLFAPNTFWHSEISMCRFNYCECGISIGYSTSPADKTYLELSFSLVYCNDCDTALYIEYGTNIEFTNCSFGNGSTASGNQFFRNRYAIKNLVFKCCNFEGCYVNTDNGVFYFTSSLIVIFEDCLFQALYPVAGVSADSTSFILSRVSPGNNTIFRRCRFADIHIGYVMYCASGDRQTYVIDWFTLMSASSTFSRKFDARDVYSGNVHSFDVTDIISSDAMPTSQPWSSNLNRFFRGVTVHVNKSTDFYMWDGGSWVKLVYVPQPPSDANTYTLKNVAGTLTWVQDT